MKTAKKIVSVTLLSAAALAVVAALIFSIYLYTIPRVSIDTRLLSNLSNVSVFYDNDGARIENNGRGKNMSYAAIDALPPYVPNAFVAIEDKRFYTHHGIDYYRVAGSILQNAKSRSYRQGASTITQQLAKNTHLTNDKNMKRKLQEMKLAKDLEKKYGKKQILEFYLNAVYFGNGAYGIESASRIYFDKGASELTLSQSAMLAGIINSPARYNPIDNLPHCIKRRNIVLLQMSDQGLITKKEAEAARAEKGTIATRDITDIEGFYVAAAMKEADALIQTTNYNALSGCKIYTYFDRDAQTVLRDGIESIKDGLPADSLRMGIIMDNASCGISAYYGNSERSIDIKRQPGSTVKPILDYAPAIEKNLICPATPILDEPINYDGYTPHNIGQANHGWMSIREALSSSNNIAAVKTLNYTGIPYARDFAIRNGLALSDKDNHFGIALGGLTDGVTLRSLTQSYATMARGGKYARGRIIKYILDKNGAKIYASPMLNHNTMREDTAYLTLDMMKTCAREGTAKKLSALPFEVAAKTGTVGLSKSKKNTDAYCISATSAHTVGVWIGSNNNKEESLLNSSVSGGSFPTAATQKIYNRLYKNLPAPFERPASIQEIPIDTTAWSTRHKLVRASSYLPAQCIKNEMFGPRMKPTDAVLETPTLSAAYDGTGIVMSYTADNYAKYQLIKSTMRDIILRDIDEIGYGKQILYDYDVSSDNFYYYQLIALYPDGSKVMSNQVKVFVED